ncbi:hypothetical protein AVEN_262915-1 [Araneus ventricosus]|uniref:CCHC-type domain-containing protein n=1 Tax=Araneus ventricosus TaxID=182803 RepID=A0A4Y2DI92_ARAVE|nr:hypothetical protein AVEN_262915-1 [Araneus ventricosus]
MNLAVKPYIPNPLRCFKCPHFGHLKVACCGTLACARCGEKNHDSLQCTAQKKCANCEGNHVSYSCSCLSWQFEKEVISVKIKQQISYPEAKKVVKTQTPTGGTSYSAAIKQSVLAKVRQIYPADTMNDSTISEETLQTTKDMHLVSDLPSSSIIRIEQPETDFKTVTMKKRPKNHLKLQLKTKVSEPIPMDGTCKKTDKDTESSEIEDEINYDPPETI